MTLFKRLEHNTLDAYTHLANKDNKHVLTINCHEHPQFSDKSDEFFTYLLFSIFGCLIKGSFMIQIY